MNLVSIDLIPIPVVICEMNGEIIRRNKLFIDVFNTVTSISDMLGPTFSSKQNIRKSFDYKKYSIEILTFEHDNYDRSLNMVFFFEENLFTTIFTEKFDKDVRSPFGGIIGMILLLAETPLNETQKEYFKILKTSSFELLKLLSNLIDYSNLLTLGFDNVEKDVKFDLNELVKSTHDTAISSFRKHQINIDSSIPKILCGDSEKIKNILINLLQNSVNATEKDFGKIITEVGIKSEKDDVLLLEFRIRDNGTGVPNDKIQDLFNEKKNLMNNFKIELGLLICKKLTELLKGTIHLESSIKDMGTTFIFTVRVLKSNLV